MKGDRPTRSASAGSCCRLRALPRSPQRAVGRSGAVVIVDDETGVGEALADALAARGGAKPPDGGRRARRPGHGGPARRAAARGARGREGARAPRGARGAHGRRRASRTAPACPGARPGPRGRGRAGGAAVLGATPLGGAFGVGGAPEGAASEGAIAGFLKSLAQEWPAVRVKAVDLASTAPETAATTCSTSSPPPTASSRSATATARGLGSSWSGSARRPSRRAAAREDSVVLVTGGARGITAEVAAPLAERTGRRSCSSAARRPARRRTRSSPG